MTIDFGAVMQAVATVLGMAVVVALCLAGIGLSCVSLSGTWLVVLAAVLAALIRDSPFPGFLTIAAFVALSAAVEMLEFAAGAWGVSRRGGSKLAGVAALAGGLIGMVPGAVLLTPLFGGFVGMLAGSFLAAYAVEHYRLKQSDAAAHIAWGAVVSRLAVLLLKVGVTLGMTIYLLLRLSSGP